MSDDTSAPGIHSNAGYWDSEVLELAKRFYYRPEFHPLLLEYLGTNGAARILDVGCGTGYLARLLASSVAGASVVGVDGDEKMLTLAEQILEQEGLSDRIELVRSDAYRLPFADGSFDLTTSHTLLCIVTDPEAALREQLDQSPWQVIGGQSAESLSWVSFQSTISGDVDGQAAITPLPPVESEDGGTLTLSNIVYFLNVQPAIPPDPRPFVLPPSREPPADFPLPFLLEGMDVLSMAWLTQPGSTLYQATLLSRESSFDVAERYRQAFASVGWEVQEDRAVGFATVVSFASEDGTAVAQLTIDSFEEDDSYTAVRLQLQEGS